MCTHLHKRSNGVYYFRRRVPLDLVEFFGKYEFNESLSTKDRRTAEVACRKKSIATDAIFAKARAMMLEEQATPGPKPQVKPLTPEQERAQWEGEQWAIEQVATDNAFVDEIREDKANRREAYRSVMAFTQAMGLDMPAADKEALQSIFARQEGEESKPADKPAGKASGPTLNDILDKWARERKPAAKTVARAQRTLDALTAASGVILAAKVERRHVLQLKDSLVSKGQTAANINVQLATMGTVFNYAVNNDLGMSANPAKGVSVTDKVRARDKRDAFDLAAMQAIFGSPVYTQHERPRGGGGEAAYWLPVLALYTGARMEELAQLRPEDVYEERYQDMHGKDCTAWVMRFVNNEAEGQRVKNEGSERRIPVHAELIRLGWLDVVRAAKKAESKRIFPELVPDVDGKASGNFSKWFGRYLRKVCGVTDISTSRRWCACCWDGDRAGCPLPDAAAFSGGPPRGKTRARRGREPHG
ncbi:DUF6538 domain-containing protein [Bordetella sp. FB-8]|uniref:DUF6538 domain-containing protein n=1 Tax=Bordetella sp. FB-8 TaxID=1159870 RepID=UPI0003A0375D|nr:DUF6538 domain-containing protein [Bordetella sp. FB-8]